MNNTWILAAGSAGATIFSSRGGKSALNEFRHFEHPEGRLHDRELTSDLPGRTYDSGGGRHTMEQSVDPKKQENINFARELTDYLEHACQSGECSKLYVAAPPAFLGLLRGKYGKPVKQALAMEVDSNLTDLDRDTVRGHFPEYL